MPGRRECDLPPKFRQPFAQAILQNDQQWDDQYERQIGERDGAYTPLPPWQGCAAFVVCFCERCL